MFKISKFKREEKGGGLILCFCVLFLMLGMGGLVVDASVLYKTKGEMRKAANAAALSGAQVMFSTDAATVVTNEVSNIVDANNENGTLQLPLSPIPNAENKVTVSLKKDVPLYFMKVFGINSTTIEVTSSAEAEPLGGAAGAMPLAVSAESIGLQEDGTFNQDMAWMPFTLKSGPSETNFGRYGLISFPSGPGAKNYMDYLTSGYPGEVNVGDKLNTESGEVAADKSIMEAKMANKTYPDLVSVQNAYNNNTLDYSNPRIMLLIVYKEASVIDGENNTKIITVAGFAYFYLYNFDESNKAIEGYFIPGVYGSIADDSALKLGAYAIKLVE